MLVLPEPESFCAAEQVAEPNGLAESEQGECGVLASTGNLYMNGDNRATCSVEQDADGRIRLAIGLITECSTQLGIDVIACAAEGGPYRWHIERAVDSACADVPELLKLFSLTSRRCAPMLTAPFALPPEGSLIRIRVSARCVGTGKTIWGRARCVVPS